jgi:hypothetical protein
LKMDETMVFKKDEEAIQEAIRAREELREAVAKALQGLQGAIRDLFRKEPTLADLEPFLVRSSGDTARRAELEVEIQTRAAEIWLRLNPYPIMPDKLMEAMDPAPSEVRAVVDAWCQVDDYDSDDLGRYWSAAKQAFAAPPVRKSERDEIERHNTLVYISPEHEKGLASLEGICCLINMKVHRPEGAVLHSHSKLAHGLTRLDNRGKATPRLELFVQPAGPPPKGFFA